MITKYEDYVTVSTTLVYAFHYHVQCGNNINHNDQNQNLTGTRLKVQF